MAAFGHMPRKGVAPYLCSPRETFLAWWYGQDNLLKRAHVSDSFELLALTGKEQVLEIGPGGLQYAVEIAKHARRIVALDHYDSIEKLGDFFRLPSNLVPMKGDAHVLPFPDQTFDVVFLSEVLPVLSEPLRCLGEIYRVLRPGGRLVTVNGRAHSQMRAIWPEPEVQANLAKAHKRFSTTMDVDAFLEAFFDLHGTSRRFHADRDAFVTSHLEQAGFERARSRWRLGVEAQRFYCRLLIEAMANTGTPRLGNGQVRHLRKFLALDTHDPDKPGGFTMFTVAYRPQEVR